ncbi:MAG: peptide deformylase [Myxococcales bacterium]|jgi:peptide deformylase
MLSRAFVPVLFAAVATGCAGAQRPGPSSPAGGESLPIVKLDLAQPDPGSVLRQRARLVDPRSPEVERLVATMRATLEQSGGVGLAAPQVGEAVRVILIKHGTRPVGQATVVRAYVNPMLEWSSEEMEDDFEGCLSIDGVGGLVRRAVAVRMSFEPLGGGERQTIELRDWDARIAQHELDHLDGTLYVDKLAGELVSADEARRLRDELHRARGWIPAQGGATEATAR